MSTQEIPHARLKRTFGEPRFHTDSELAALAYAHDGLLWSIEEAGWLRCWSADGRQLRQTLLSDLETLWHFSPDALWLASASDDVTLWDVRLSKIFKLPSGREFEAILDGFNLLNQGANTVVNTNAGATFGRPVQILPPRIARLGARLRF